MAETSFIIENGRRLDLKDASARKSIGSCTELKTDAKHCLVHAINELCEKVESGGGSGGGSGTPGEPGEPGGYYTPIVQQTDDDEVMFAFEPSESDMPVVNPQRVSLPRGPQGIPGERGETGPRGPAGPAGSDATVTVDASLSDTSTNPVQNKVVYAALSKKANDYSIELYNGTGGNPKPVRFATVNYSTCGSENGVAIKIGMVSGHGNGVSYAFLQDAIIRVSYLGGVEVDNFKYYGAEAPAYDGAIRQYGDIFWVVDTTNKIVDFYCLMGQYSRVYQTPWKRLTYSSGGVVTQHTSVSVYSSGEIMWANNNTLATASDISADNVTFSDGDTFQDKYDSGELKGETGPQGEQGPRGYSGSDGGYYTPDISQVDEQTMLIQFERSDGNMENGPAFYVTLPRGPQGEQGPQGPAGSSGSLTDHEHNADYVRFDDGDTLQQKYDNGDFSGGGGNVDLSGYLPKSGGTLTGELVVNGGDAVGASKFVLATGKGQITNSGTQTLFGFTAETALSVGHSSYTLRLRGSAARPTYNNADVALQSDIPSTYAGSSSAGGAATSAVKLANARTVRVNLGSSLSATFNGESNITPGVSGTLSVANGGTGGASAAAARQNLSVYSKAEVDAMIAAGGGSAAQISFQVDGTTYKCAFGTTWADWANTAEGGNVVYIDRDDAVCGVDTDYYVTDYNGTEQNAEDVIVNGEHYYTYPQE